MFRHNNFSLKIEETFESYKCLCGNAFEETARENETACMKMNPNLFCEHVYYLKSTFLVFKIERGL